MILMDFPRGITPGVLLEQVRNTVPFIFEAHAPVTPSPYLETVRQAQPEAPLTHHEYFQLCVSAHFATVSSFVPTDVDNQIRFKLWHPELPLEELFAMSDLVAEALRWDMTVVSRRYVKSPSTGAVLSGMHGEWFSIAAGSYCALRKRTEPEASEKKASELEELILGEMNREAAILGELLQSRDGIGVLAAATSIAHNLGDLDRVMDQWNLDPSDPLRKTAYKSGHEGRDRFQGLLWLAGELNKATLSPTSMADENHRHFALRSNKCLRRSPDFLLPISPFFDSWGATIGRHPMLQPEEVAEIVRALMDGWERVKPSGRTQAYPRALAGIESTFNGGLSRLCNYLPSKDAKTLRAGALRTACSLDRRRFEDTWSQQALKLADRLRIA